MIAKRVKLWLAVGLLAGCFVFGGTSDALAGPWHYGHGPGHVHVAAYYYPPPPAYYAVRPVVYYRPAVAYYRPAFFYAPGCW